MSDIVTAHPDEDLAAYATGALDGDEREVVAAHLAACARCRAEVAAYEGVARVARDEGIRARPSERNWDAIRAAIAAAAPSPLPAPAQMRRRWPRRVVAAWGVAAAVVVGLFAWNLALQADDDGATLADQLPATGTYVYVVAPIGAGSGSGRVFMSEDLKRGTVAVTGLPELPGSRAYTAWLVRDDQTRVKVAAFDVDSRGDAVARLTLPAVLRGFSGFAVSESSSTEVAAPDGPDVLVGPLY